MARPVLGIALILALVACRDDVSPFEAPPRPIDPNASIRQLTFSPGDDRSPIWSANGDSIYYSAEGFDHLPDEPGVLVGLPHTGGAAREILNNVSDAGRAGFPLWLIAPTLSPDGERLAFAHVGPPWPERPCAGTLACSPERDTLAFPPIRSVFYRVRPLDEVGPLGDDPTAMVTMPGVEARPTGIPNITHYDIRVDPSQRLFADEGLLFFRPSWDPAGERIVFSDGASLKLWQVGDEEVAPIPNTEAAVSPAWRPDGEWIAYSRVTSLDSVLFNCAYLTAFGSCSDIQYQIQSPGARTLVLIRPDGTDARELGPGEDPAWSPDGSTIYFRRGDSIWRMAADGSDPSAVEGTNGGRDPAVSPDGTLLAFARRTARGDHDIWVLELDSSPEGVPLAATMRTVDVHDGNGPSILLGAPAGLPPTMEAGL